MAAAAQGLGCSTLLRGTRLGSMQFYPPCSAPTSPPETGHLPFSHPHRDPSVPSDSPEGRLLTRGREKLAAILALGRFWDCPARRDALPSTRTGCSCAKVRSAPQNQKEVAQNHPAPDSRAKHSDHRGVKAEPHCLQAADNAAFCEQTSAALAKSNFNYLRCSGL